MIFFVVGLICLVVYLCPLFIHLLCYACLEQQDRRPHHDPKPRIRVRETARSHTACGKFKMAASLLFCHGELLSDDCIKEFTLAAVDEPFLAVLVEKNERK